METQRTFWNLEPVVTPDEVAAAIAVERERIFRVRRRRRVRLFAVHDGPDAVSLYLSEWRRVKARPPYRFPYPEPASNPKTEPRSCPTLTLFT